jgi:hypothetical protein
VPGVRQVLRKTLLIFLIAAAVLISAHFLLRNFIAEKITERLNNKLQQQYGLSLLVSNMHFTGYKTLMIPHLAIVPQNGDTLLSLDSLSLNPSLIALLTLKLRLNELALTDGRLNLSCRDSTCNFRFNKVKEDSAEAAHGEKDYAQFFYRVYSKMFDLIPEHATIHRFNIAYRKEHSGDNLILASYNNSADRAEGELKDSTGKTTWKMELTLNKGARQFDFKIYPLGRDKMLPFLSGLFNLSLSFDTLQFAAEDNHYTSGEFALNGKFHSSSLLFVQPKISDDSILIQDIYSMFRFRISPATFELDSNTFVDLNSLRIKPFIRYVNKKGKDYTLSLKTEPINATDFFQSLPEGMFNGVQQIEADGNLSYLLNFHLNSGEPDSLSFDSEMKKERFRLRKFGKNSLLKMNSEFPYTAYEYDKPFKTFLVGPSNPSFTPLEQISPYLRNAVLTSEDGSFFYHNGFNEDAFRKSIATNYKEGKFKRGGSTISMQLIKNVYLSRHKTIARKAEEALLVWLIESNHLVSKERMFEVYLNIIELGPGIYGVGEASEFYFNKKPSQLTLSESIFIASLLPHPKWFKYSFDEQGDLKPYFADYYRVVSNFMLRKNLINQEEYDAIQPNVKLTGAARAAIIPSDTIPQEETDEESR